MYTSGYSAPVCVCDVFSAIRFVTLHVYTRKRPFQLSLLRAFLVCYKYNNASTPKPVLEKVNCVSSFRLSHYLCASEERRILKQRNNNKKKKKKRKIKEEGKRKYNDVSTSCSNLKTPCSRCHSVTQFTKQRRSFCCSSLSIEVAPEFLFLLLFFVRRTSTSTVSNFCFYDFSLVACTHTPTHTSTRLS